MKTKPIPKINIVTLGCSKNTVDSEVLLSQLKANNIEAVHESKKNNFETVIINTCGFIDNAKQESVDTILHYVEQKKKGKVEKVIVTGCLSHRYKDDLVNELPDVDAFFGTLDLPNLLSHLGADYKHNLIGERLTTTPKHYAYLKISEGCDRPCSFCAIPLMRGKHTSKPIELIISEAKNLVKNGTKEIMLIAQDSTFYGIDLYGKRKLDELLLNLSDVEGLDWIRLHYAYPSQFPEEILDIMASKKNICKYLDMPIQHSSDAVLKVMRRGITQRRTQELIDTIREKVPNIALRTTVMVGHPGETLEEFEKMLDFIEKNKFERLGVFTYSHEENTHAYSLDDSISKEEKDNRASKLMNLQQDISMEINQKKINTIQKVLFDRKEGDFFIGRTEHDSPEVDNEVLVKAEANYVRIGDFAHVLITDCDAFDLYGELSPKSISWN